MPERIVASSFLELQPDVVIEELSRVQLAGTEDEPKWALQGLVRAWHYQAGGVTPEEVAAGQTFTEGLVPGQEVSLVERPYEPAYPQAWLGFRDIGLPVAPTLLKTSRDTLLTTDMKRNGGELYGKYLSLMLQQRRRPRPPRPSTDAHFLALAAQDFEPIKERAAGLRERATEGGVRLPADAFELHMEPDGRWNLVTIDLDATTIRDRSEGRGEHNRVYVSAFLQRLGIVERALRRQMPPRSV